jgi:1-acyl-sn-glycerol-3-phosphate acyltransferase
MGALRFVVAVGVSLGSAALELLLIWVDRRRGRLFHGIARMWAHSVLRVSSVTVSVKGLEHLDRTRSYVYVSNHASMFDIPAIIAGIPDQFRIVYKKELEMIPVFGWGLKAGPYIAIDRGRGAEAMRSLDRAIRRIRSGASLLLYAEGTRTRDGKLQPFKRGAFNIAARAGIPVVPLTVNGSFSILRKSSIMIRPGHIELVIAPPIPIPEGEGREVEMALMSRVHAAMAANYIDQE